MMYARWNLESEPTGHWFHWSGSWDGGEGEGIFIRCLSVPGPVRSMSPQLAIVFIFQVPVHSSLSVLPRLCPPTGLGALKGYYKAHTGSNVIMVFPNNNLLYKQFFEVPSQR